MDRGADGFRVDVAQGLMKSSDFADNPQLRPLRDGMTNWEVWHSFDHVHDIDQDLNIEVFRRWNSVVEPYGVMLLAGDRRTIRPEADRPIHARRRSVSQWVLP